jgi:YrbI family 3-deoxy-D-manno-octulosonate 8-phosphate phosphatase
MGFDVDGVLTDGTLYFGSEGDEIKAFSSLDGHGLKMLQHAGIEVAIISGRSSPPSARAPKISASANCTWASRTSAA